jgi:hypothetical protein
VTLILPEMTQGVLQLLKSSLRDTRVLGSEEQQSIGAVDIVGRALRAGTAHPHYPPPLRRRHPAPRRLWAPAGDSQDLMSALVLIRPDCCSAAKRRDGP